MDELILKKSEVINALEKIEKEITNCIENRDERYYPFNEPQEYVEGYTEGYVDAMAMIIKEFKIQVGDLSGT